MRVRNEEGSALVLVISAVFLIGALLTTLTSITLTTSGRAGATRADSEAVAAAEGGLEKTARLLFAPGPDRMSCEWDSAGSDGLSYTVNEIYYAPAGSTTYKPCTGSQIPEDANLVKLIVTGQAERPNYRNPSGNEARIERIFERPKTLGLHSAIFAGAYLSPENGAISASDQEGKPGDVVSRGNIYCKAGSPSAYTGNVYALGGFTTQNDCIIHGDLFVKGNLNVSTKLTVEGRTFVDGNVTINNPGEYKKDVYITGDLNGSGNTIFNSVLRVGGKIQAGNGMTFKSDLYVKKDMNLGYNGNTFGGNIFVGGNVGDINPGQLSTVPTGRKLYYKGNVPNFTATDKFEKNPAVVDSALSGAAWELPKELKPENFTSLGYDYPFIKKDDPTFANWSRMSKADFAAQTGMNPTTCDLNDSSSTKHTIRFDVATVVDLSDCNFQWHNGNVTLVLNADVVILAKTWRSDGASSGNSFLTVKAAGVAGAHTVRPKLHIIVPASDAQASSKTCSANAGTNDLTFTNLKFDQTGYSDDPNDHSVSTELVLYSSGSLLIGDVKTKPIYAQLYGCAVTAWSSLQVTYSPDDEVSRDLLALQTKVLRDITY